MNLIFIGDIVGPDATDYVIERLPALRREHAADLVIVNGENCAVTASTPWKGFGITYDQVERLLANGTDVITSGNHGWDGAEVDLVHSHHRVLRPLNMPEGTPGKGSVSLTVNNTQVTVLNLAGVSAIEESTSPYDAWSTMEKRGTVIVDFHSDEAWQKMVFATAVDGEAAAVLGTHSHEPTIPLYILPGGTAYVTDVGMTAVYTGPGGFPLMHFAAKRKGIPYDHLPAFKPYAGVVQLGAVLLHIEGNQTTHIQRIY